MDSRKRMLSSAQSIKLLFNMLDSSSFNRKTKHSKALQIRLQLFHFTTCHSTVKRIIPQVRLRVSISKKNLGGYQSTRSLMSPIEQSFGL